MDAYLRYAAFRIELKAAVESFRKSECYKQIEGNVLSLKLADIAQKGCRLQPGTAPPPTEKASDVPETTGIDKKPPSAPRNFTISSIPDELQKIEDLLYRFIKLGNLPLAKQLSHSTNHAIEQWVTLLWERLWKGGSRPEVLPDGTGLIPQEGLSRFLTFQDILDLNAIDFPGVTNIDTMQSQLRVQVPSVPIPSDLGTSAILAQFGILLSVGYFLLYQTEAQHSKTFPASGTFFAIFNRTPTRHSLFLFLTASPPIISLLITSQSTSQILTLVNSFIFLNIFWICAQIAHCEGQIRFHLMQHEDTSNPV